MSGFEIVGVVLGAYPILYDTAKDLRGASKKVKSWWFFEREFDDFVSEVQKEWIAFSQILEILLDPIDLTPDERQRLQDEPECSLWHESHVQTQIRERITPKYYEWFMGQLLDMNNALNELHSMLPIANVHLLSSTSVEAELFRLKRTFSNRKGKLLATIQSRNEALFNFLEKASHITRSYTPVVPPKSHSRSPFKKFGHLQKHSQYAYLFLRKKWTCGCSHSHHCGIAIEQSDIDPSLTLLVSDEERSTRMRLIFDSLPVPTQEPSQTKHEEVAELKQQISLKRKLRELKPKQSPGALSLAMSTLSLMTNPFSSGRSKVELEKGEKKLKKKSLVLLGSNVSSDASQTGSAQGEIGERAPRGVRFVDDSTLASPASFSLSTRQIDNICDIVSSSVTKGYEASEVIHQNTRLFLLAENKENQIPSQATIEDFITATAGRDKRLRIAVSILRSVLYLGASQWIPTSWDKAHLILINNDSSDPQPYFKSALLSDLRSVSDSGKQVDKTRVSFFTIGVLLLELLFRETFETQPFRAQFLNAMGQANEATDLCAALQWHQRVSEECGYELSDAIRRCILCAFDAPPNLSDPSFVEAVWYGVVKPLETFLSAWNRDPVRNLV
ncbi:hypothetical protein GGR51DRAFT_546053 [Nemania sp. FL0031]|nr:hypothetical protein GGR51DRAFT_546053 [Nemania sp. FL0031]